MSEARKEIGRQSAKRPRRKEIFAAPSRREERSAAAGPPDLNRLFAHEQRRFAARRANDAAIANYALPEVVGDLNHLLDTVAEQLRLTGRGRSRQKVKDAVAALVATDRLVTLPLRDVADLLDIPRGEVDATLVALARNGGISPTERLVALEQVERLRALLRHVESTKDHPLLDRLRNIIVEITLLVMIAVAATPLGTMVVGDPVIKEVIKAGLIALVAVSLQSTVEGLREWRKERDPHTIAALRTRHFSTSSMPPKDITRSRHTMASIR